MSKFSYDSVNRMKTETLPDGTQKGYFFRPEGVLHHSIDANGTQVTYGYDNALRMIHKDMQRGAGVEGTTYEDYWYDGANRITFAQNDYSTVTRKYNSYSEVYEETSAVTINGATQTKTVNSEFDRLGNRTALVYPSGKRLNYTRDELDRTKNILDEYGKPLAQYAYNGYRIKQRKSGNGTQLDIAYDAMRRITKMDTTKDGTPFTRIAGFEYGYNDEGMKTFENRLSGTGEISQQAKGNIFTYDSIYQVTGVKYDVLNVTQELNQPGTQTFAKQIGYNFDDSGNRTATTATPYGQAPVTQNYQANSLNQYTSIDSGIFAYDNVGNMTQGVIYIDDSANPGSKTPELVNFIYDYTNRLLRVERQNDVAILGEYSYDVFGRRTYKSAWDSTSQSYAETCFWYNGAECIEETDNTGNTIATYTFGIAIDEAINVEYPVASQQYPDYGTYWYHTDALGSVTALTDSDGTVIERYKYDIYGEATVLASDGQTVRAESMIGNRILYTGREYDKETGLYYYRARYYHAQFGRLISADSIGANGLGNLFTYTNNSSINYYDPYGTEGLLKNLDLYLIAEDNSEQHSLLFGKNSVLGEHKSLDELLMTEAVKAINDANSAETPVTGEAWNKAYEKVKDNYTSQSKEDIVLLLFEKLSIKDLRTTGDILNGLFQGNATSSVDYNYDLEIQGTIANGEVTGSASVIADSKVRGFAELSFGIQGFAEVNTDTIFAVDSNGTLHVDLPGADAKGTVSVSALAISVLSLSFADTIYWPTGIAGGYAYIYGDSTINANRDVTYSLYKLYIGGYYMPDELDILNFSSNEYELFLRTELLKHTPSLDINVGFKGSFSSDDNWGLHIDVVAYF